MNSYTDEDILRFLYDEMSEDESSAFLADLCTDEALWERYEMFQEVAEQTSGLRFEPSEESIQKIEAFARTVPVEAEFAHVESESKPEPGPSFSLANTLVMAVCALLIGSGLAFVTPGTNVQPLAPQMASQVPAPMEDISVIAPVNSPAADPVVQWDDSQIDQQIDLLWEGISKVKSDNPAML
jgi:anti-sigma factor RsiW